MARHFISFLGTNDYLPCTYYRTGEEMTPEVRFVQEAMAEILCRRWSGEDRITVFTTRDALEKNWRDNGQRDREGKPLERLGLEQALSRRGLPCKVESIIIPEGGSEDEIWQIFSTVLDAIQDQSSLYLDITHAFRSIPLLGTVVLHYAKVVKEASIEGIYYGAFEALGTPWEVKSIPVEERLVPIFDLTPFVTLLDWSLAFDRFIGAGDAKPVSDLARKGVMPMLKATQGKDAVASAVRIMADRLEDFTLTLATCRGKGISGAASRLQERLNDCKKVDVQAEMIPLLEKVETRMAPFAGDATRDGVAAARWCLDHSLYQQGFTILSETLVSHVAAEAGLNPEERKDRIIANQAAKIFKDNLLEDLWKPEARSNAEKTKKCLAFFDGSEGLADKILELAGLRNDINHAGFTQSAMPPRSVESKLKNILEDVESALGLS
ncbi:MULTISPECIES: TIGR02221 family CRISPR-associated protein [Desulfatibacillum]|jgi:CRISPR-associated Csx2 family protein|uniref:CRISPR-associated protein, TM1812 family n=1 Tax=Desulfatibacillum alkenivorans DSM 16219 TaxID=1121393 RepID=A0A1M6QTF2_9BACT|nr:MULTISPECIES: TIGR02221 family CRISPR-associated protein [Desulfatibacillum]SHK23531.1 CRISPR-associated protein, TM1812 family [Desulfatibacillum alkenivorans DSM 16219]